MRMGFIIPPAAKLHTFYGKARKLVNECDRICNEYAEKGYALTLRQLFYQLVTRIKIANTVKEYEDLGRTVKDARYAGELDWDHIEDRVRVLQQLVHWRNAK